jgi:hypothetical protein
MAKKSRMSVLKRQREARKQEKAALKRERREQRKTDSPVDSEDMSGYFGDVEEEATPEAEAEAEAETQESP